MSKIREIFQNMKPLSRWRRRSDEETEQKDRPLSAGETLSAWRERTLVVPRGAPRVPVEWRLIEDDRVLRETFLNLRGSLYAFNQRMKGAPALPPPFYTEAGKLAGDRSYFYLKRWEDMGLLFEETSRGWVISRADKISSQSQFMRERSPWDQVLLYWSPAAPGVCRLESELMGEGRVSLALYEDFIIETLRKAL